MKKLLVILSCLLILCACTKIERQEEIQINKEKTFLGNITDENGDMVLLLNSEVNLTTANPLYKDELVNLAKEEITNYHKLLDSHHYYLDDNNNRINNINVLNDNIDNGPIVVDHIIIDALKEAKNLSVLTKGYFNFTLGELSDLYHDKLLPYDSTNIDPDSKDINDSLNGIINYDELDEYIIVDETNNTVELKSKSENKFKIDLGAFSKGYILNKVYEQLKKYDSSFLLTAGSSSIITYSSPKENISWSVGVKNPCNNEEMLVAFYINNGALSTSGDYENYYFLEDGTRRHHILNPFSGYSENYYRSNTLTSSNACVIDALSTALFNIKDDSERVQIINDIKDYYKIDIDYCFVKDGIEIIMNQSFSDNLIDSYTSITIKNTIIE